MKTSFWNHKLNVILCIFIFSAPAFSSSSVEQSAFSNSLSFSVLVTAESSGSLEAMVVEDGSWFTKRKLVHTAVLVKHPKGDFLFDSGIGRQYVDQLSVFNFFEKLLFKIENVRPARDQLEQANYDISSIFAVIPSHMHWDHASGLEDFTNIPVWLPKNSHDEAMHGHSPAFVISQYDDSRLTWKYLNLEGGDYQGFPKIMDIFQDGTVILVDLSGHTEGQVGMFLNLPSGDRYFFIGDTTWSKLGVVNNKPRPKIVEWLVGVDTDFEENSKVIDKIHKLGLSEPDLVIVPAHDEIVVGTLPVFPEFSN